MSMVKSKQEKVPYLGDLEKYVMKAILNNTNNSYGVAIREELEKAFEKKISYAAIYTTLERLESKGMLTSTKGEATKERGGRAKMYFQVTGAGQRALEESLDRLVKLGFSFA